MGKRTLTLFFGLARTKSKTEIITSLSSWILSLGGKPQLSVYFFSPGIILIGFLLSDPLRCMQSFLRSLCWPCWSMTTTWWEGTIWSERHALTWRTDSTADTEPPVESRQSTACKSRQLFPALMCQVVDVTALFRNCPKWVGIRSFELCPSLLVSQSWLQCLERLSEANRASDKTVQRQRSGRASIQSWTHHCGQ